MISKEFLEKYKALPFDKKMQVAKIRAKRKSKEFFTQKINAALWVMGILVALVLVLQPIVRLVRIEMSDYLHCVSCNEFFVEQNAHFTKLRHAELGGGENYETVLACPYCKSDDLESAEVCSICTRPTMDYVCEDCRETIRKSFSNFVDSLSEDLQTTTDDIKNVIADFCFN